MSFAAPYVDYDFLTNGVVSRRCAGWLIDVVLVGLLVLVLWWMLVMFGFLTFGLGFGGMGILPFVPFCYHFLSLIGAASATPGQQIMGLTVRRNEDLGRPYGIQALAAVLVFYFTMATSGALLVVVLFTRRHRALHDLVSGLVVVRVGALTTSSGGWNMNGGTSPR